MKTPSQAALEMAQTLIETERGSDPLTFELISKAVDDVLRLKPQWRSTGAVDPVALKSELEARYSVWIGKSVVLEQNDDHVHWLNEARKKSWRLWPRYRQFLERGWSPLAVEALDEATDEIFSRLEDPNRGGRWDRRGLVVGHVQSGKTSNYTGLMCKAVDAGYKVIIVLAGIHNNLRSQTQMRLDEGFLGYETMPRDDAGTTKIKTIGVGEIDPDPAIRPNYVTTRDEKGDFNRTRGKSLGIAPGGQALLFVVKKNGSVLKNLLYWINGILNGRQSLADIPLLVIDDEADHASVDTKEQAFDEDGKPDPDHDPTRINGYIRQILTKFEKVAYVGYTATPFANIFIHDSGRTSKEGDDLFPRSFIINLPAPSNYDGPVRLFGLDPSDEKDDGLPGLPLVRTVSDHAVSNAIDERSGWVPPIHKKTHVPQYDGRKEVPPSLRQAIYSFVIACAARRARGQLNAHNSMLVHVTRFADVQKCVREQVENELKTIQRRLRYGEEDPQLKRALERLWREDFVPTTAKVENVLGVTFGRISWAAVEAHLAQAAADIQVRTINGTAGDILDYELRRDSGFNVIAIGGDKLARGLTLEGLTVSYFLRASKMYDTLMQMGRWFGYRPGYLDLCRLYTTPDLEEWFCHITEAAEELRREFDHMRTINGTPKDYGLKVQSHPVMMVTSRVKMRHATQLDVDFAGAIAETVDFHRDQADIKANMEAAEHLVSRLGTPNESGPTRKRPGNALHRWQSTRLWSGVAGADVVAFLKDYRTHETATRVNSQILAEYVATKIAEGQLTSWEVALMGGAKEHTTTEVAGFKVPMIERSINIRAYDPEEQKVLGRHIIRRILAPRDEAIDLDEKEYAEALQDTVKSWHADPGRSRRKTPPDDPSGPSIRLVRGKYHQDRALLLLYPLDPAVPGINLGGLPIMGFGISFPSSGKKVTVKYTVNNIYWEQEYGSAA
jgi:hypothetical protein